MASVRTQNAVGIGALVLVGAVVLALGYGIIGILILFLLLCVGAGALMSYLSDL